jgi:hypothetical protein
MNTPKTNQQLADEEALTRTLPCGVHPQHHVKVRADGSRSGCPMCEDAIADLTRSRP